MIFYHFITLSLLYWTMLFFISNYYYLNELFWRFFMDEGEGAKRLPLPEMSHCQHKTIWIIFGQAAPTKSKTWNKFHYLILLFNICYHLSLAMATFLAKSLSNLISCLSCLLSNLIINKRFVFFSWSFLQRKNCKSESKITNLANIRKNVIWNLEVNIAIVC